MGWVDDKLGSGMGKGRWRCGGGDRETDAGRQTQGGLKAKGERRNAPGSFALVETKPTMKLQITTKPLKATVHPSDKPASPRSRCPPFPAEFPQ